VSSDPDAKKPPDAGGSGSVEIELSGPRLPATAAPEPVAAEPSISTGAVVAVPAEQSAPVSSGPVAAVAADPTGPVVGVKRARKITAAIQDTVSGGVEKLGSGIDTFGKGVSKLGDHVPLVGGSVGKLGEGITKAGESIHALPRVAQTRRGRLLLRSAIVGFVLVFLWIAAIVAFQLRENDTPDFRPQAEKILVEISAGSAAIDKLYESASPRFQEMVRQERFIDDMTDLNATVGKFREITAINDTLVTTGPTGKVGRVSLTAAYEKGVCKGSISFHWDDGWKLLGIGINLPPELKITQAAREHRVSACADPDNRKTCDVRDAAETILEWLRDGRPGEVWDSATAVFKKQETRAMFSQIQAEHRAALGAYKRILRVTEAKMIGGSSPTSPASSATFDVLAEFEKSSGVRVMIGLERAARAAPWQLRSFKVVVPNPRADDAAPATSAKAPPPTVPGDAGVARPRDAGSHH
jgi:hypothetical protein